MSKDFKKRKVVAYYVGISCKNFSSSIISLELEDETEIILNDIPSEMYFGLIKYIEEKIQNLFYLSNGELTAEWENS